MEIESENECIYKRMRLKAQIGRVCGARLRFKITTRGAAAAKVGASGEAGRRVVRSGWNDRTCVERLWRDA